MNTPADTSTDTNQAIPKPRWFRRLMIASTVIVSMSVIAVLTFPYTLPWLLDKQDIEFQWEHPRWHLDGFSASNIKIKLRAQGSNLKQIELNNLRLYWTRHKFPIRRLEIDHLQAYWPLTNPNEATETEPLVLSNALYKWLPQEVQLTRIEAQITDLGLLQGNLNLQASHCGLIWQPRLLETSFTLKNIPAHWFGNIPPELRPEQLQATIQTHPDYRTNGTNQQQLSVLLKTLGPTRLKLSGILDLQHTTNWVGELRNGQLSAHLNAFSNPQLQAEQLQLDGQFTARADTQGFHLALMEHATLKAEQLQLQEVGQAQNITLELTAFDLHVPYQELDKGQLTSTFHGQITQLTAAPLHNQDWIFAGSVSGLLPKLKVEAQLNGQYGLQLTGQAQPLTDSIQGYLSLNEITFNTGNPLQKTFTVWPDALVLNSGHLHSHLEFKLPYEAPLQFTVQTTARDLIGTFDQTRFNRLNLKLSSATEVTAGQEWQAQLQNTQLKIQADKVADHTFIAQQVKANVHLSAHANAQTFSLQFAQDTQVHTQSLSFRDLGQAQQAKVQLAQLLLSGHTRTPEQLKLSSPIRLSLTQLSSNRLHKQDWDLQGHINGQLPRLQFTGTLSNQQGLHLTSNIHIQNTAITGSITPQELSFHNDNVLQKTFTDWPEIILLNKGHIHSQINFTLPNQSPLQLTVRGSGKGLSGIANRSELENLNLNFNLQLNGENFKLYIPHLDIGALDPGVPLSSIQLSDASYRGDLNNLSQGVASWHKLQAKLLNGRVWIDEQELNLRRSQKLLLHIKGLELEELFRVYPAEGLAGNGTIDGLLPIYFDQNEIYIQAGQLEARGPGVLRFQSEKIQALGKSNPAMAIVADALDDFHFNHLTSGLSYDQSGKLTLKIRLKGQNPDIEKGRPIHLNVNLEDDIPALLASIQLSGQVSEIIQKRVRERLENR